MSSPIDRSGHLLWHTTINAGNGRESLQAMEQRRAEELKAKTEFREEVWSFVLHHGDAAGVRFRREGIVG